MAQHAIKNGPSKFDLAVALFQRPADGEQHYVVIFQLEDGRKLQAILQAVSAESGSRESWLIDGWFKDSGGKKFTGYFETRSRKGYLKFD